jgi:hypothetical protein
MLMRCRERAALNLQLISDLCDLTVPTSAIGLTSFDDGFVGLAGTVSSLIASGRRQHEEVVLAGRQKNVHKLKGWNIRLLDLLFVESQIACYIPYKVQGKSILYYISS